MTRYRTELSIAVAYAALLAVVGVVSPAFYAPANVEDLLMSAAPLLVAAVGMTAVILARQIDVSIGSEFAIAGVVLGLLAKAGMPMPFAVVGAIAAGAALGAVNGVLVAGLGLPSIVVTLATMVGWREALRWITGGVWVQDLPPGFQWVGLGQRDGRFAVVSVAVIVWLLFAWALRHLAGGRAIYATGSDPEVARLAGLRPTRVIFGVFVLMGALAGLAAVLSTVQFVDVQTSAGVGLELRVIAAVVVGGTAINGGRGSLGGTLVGVLLLSGLGPALVFLGANASWERALEGAIILAAVSIDAILPRRSRRVRA